MGNASIPLAKGFNRDKLDLPVFISRKFDGVPVKITVTEGYKVSWVSRSGKPLPSLTEYMRLISSKLQQRPLPFSREFVLVAEVTHENLTSFKDVSGLVRKKEPQVGFTFNVFDAYFDDPEEAFNGRIGGLYKAVDHLPPFVRGVNQIKCNTLLELEQQIEYYQLNFPDWEGLVARSGNAAFKPNSRHWDYQKIVVDPTVDLRIVGMEEATSADGEPLGMVGRLIAEFHSTQIGIGPGKLSHDERRELWQYHQKGMSSGERIACIKYKRDDSYDALRQPTFQHWRPEKTEPSYD